MVDMIKGRAKTPLFLNTRVEYFAGLTHCTKEILSLSDTWKKSHIEKNSQMIAKGNENIAPSLKIPARKKEKKYSHQQHSSLNS